MIEEFTLILNARLKPEAKNPPKGPITELKTLIDNECSRNGYIVIVLFIFNCMESNKKSIRLFNCNLLNLCG